ncbi:LysM peptidoglycan-binding domain-containing protein [Paenibacillus sp. HW567]|uniref:LysM peptidoglycan-binding domain-containing protein n=1 Tax=Paenibacillus sp. HW567 TaxID=1034769 RepID=UPI00037D9617|nr:LysM peptidoglycan-binding domain-containing protein [Paenibacillus sp. HW567]
MFDQSHGLRFDIYERIHLPAELPGIAELEEVELIPDIQVIQREDRAELYGQLLLTGLYRGEDDRTQRLEHAIPVEITVPLTRVSSLDDIGVEIENFDIDLLTMRTVNITGVLSLHGIGTGDTQPAWQQEEYTVAYSPEEEGRVAEAPAGEREHESEALYENSLWTYNEGATDISAHVAENVSSNGNPWGTVESAANPPLPEAVVSTQPADLAPEQQKDKEAKLRTHNLNSGISASDNTGSVESSAETPSAEVHAVYQEELALSSEALDNEASSPNEPAAESAPENENVPELSPEVQTMPEEKEKEKADLKIGVGSKKEEKPAAQEHLSFSSLLGAGRVRKEQEIQHSEQPVSAPAAPEAGNDTEWKSRFIGGLNGADMFRKVRLCIVQREDTLDTIAEKYQLSARELVMYNRLSGQNVEEGQVLYIP